MDVGCSMDAKSAEQSGRLVTDLRPSGDEVIVVIDDDALMGETLIGNLEDAGYRAVLCENGTAALRYFAGGGPASAILLDWSMPDIDGPALVRKLRATGQTIPVVFLTGHSEAMFEEAALACGAADFVDKSKTFSIVLRRLRLALGAAKRPVDAAAEASGITFDDGSARVYWRGERVDLTLGEFKVVRFLVAQAGKDVPYRAIYDVLRGEGFHAGAGDDGFRANVRAMVKRIRQAFRNVDDRFDMIENYPGFGYRWSDAKAAGAKGGGRAHSSEPALRP